MIPARVGSDSRISFDRPAGEFQILFDAAPGHVVEVDWNHVEGITR